MERKRRGSVYGSARQPKLTSVVENQLTGSKFGGSVVAPELPHDETSLTIDPNLLVGPLYVPATSQADKIKAQLGDITSKLHKTLYDFDEYADFKHGEDPVLAMMRTRIHRLDDNEMRSNLSQFIDQYEDMSHQVSSANRDRDEMLMQLADWFTTDHVDLDDIKESIDETEEEHIKQSYFATVTNFEKLKKLQSQIAVASRQGKPIYKLEQQKAALEKDVVDKFRVMKDMSMQTMKLKVSDDSPWRYAANEIVSMLQNVRGENAVELTLITKKMQDMVDQLEKQAVAIKSLTAELREKKEVMKRLTDENCDLSQDVSHFRARYARYEKDLDAAKQLIRSLHMEKLESQATGIENTPANKTMSESISKVLAVFDHKPVEVTKIKSDPALLRTQIKEYEEALECIRSEYARAAEDIEDLTTEIAEKKDYIDSIEDENEKLRKDIKKLRQDRRQSMAVSEPRMAQKPAGGDIHTCEHCKCHDSVKEEELEDVHKEADKWREKYTYFKKCLADTEMKLSEAYKEISELRMDREPPQSKHNSTRGVIAAPTPKPKSVQKDKGENNMEAMKTEPTFANEEKPPNKPRPKPQVRARYLDTKPRPDNTILPPIDNTAIEEKTSMKLTPKQMRELKLYQAGDIQGRLNMLIGEVMGFAGEIGKMLHTDREDDNAKIQSMKAFTFDNSVSGLKKQKDKKDMKEEEARSKKNAAILSGQQAVAKLREAYDLLSSSMNIQHNEYEAIYRSFKISQQRNSIRQAVLMGRMPVSALQEFDKEQRKMMLQEGQDTMLNVYFNISYGSGQPGLGVQTSGRSHPSRDHNPRQSSSASDTEETEAKLKNTMHVLNMQRSKSDLDTRNNTPSNIGSGLMMGHGLLRERSQIYVTNVPDQMKRESTQGGTKQEMKVGVAIVPRKGLISLSTADQSDIVTGVPDERKWTPLMMHDTHSAGSGSGKKSLIKNKAILEQIRLGNKLLEDAEEERRQKEEISQSLGDYTIQDLQSKLLEMTDNKVLGRSRILLADPGSTENSRKGVASKPEKSITLPAIKNLNPFIMKS